MIIFIKIFKVYEKCFEKQNKIWTIDVENLEIKNKSCL